MSMGVIFFLLLAVIQISLICCTKLVANYSAWIAARVWAVNTEGESSKAKQAGVAVLKTIEWKTISEDFIGVQPANEGVMVEYPTTLGIPFVLTNDSAGRITVEAWASVPRDPNLDESEKGDNRER